MTSEAGSQRPEPKPAPELAGGAWLQGGPVRIGGSGRVFVIDFWDYTCVNCLRTLPYLTEWHRRYEEHGLTIVGVHTPEFSFARNDANVRSALGRFAIDYPVVLDADFAIWRAYENQYWPAKYFVDHTGNIVARHYGEGAYAESETLIQFLLQQRAASIGLEPGALPFPEVMEPVRPEDSTGAVCYRVTPELYCGYRRGLIGNVGGIERDRPQTFRDPGKHMEGTLYLEGDWQLQAESASRPFGAKNPSRMHLDYMAADVNLVLHPPITGQPGEVRVTLDGAPLQGDLAGEEVRDGVITVSQPRMYSLITANDVDRHSLTLETTSDGLAAYAFTFTSCVTEPPSAPADGDAAEGEG